MTFQGKIVYLYESLAFIIESPSLCPQSVVDPRSEKSEATK